MMNVLSLFDGMACGMLAMLKANIKVDRYVAFEIDKYAIQTSSYNFSTIEHRGDVFNADFTEFEGFDFLVGGSPCTYWSIAQKNNRETEASGMGWELFSQYVRALKESKPKYFIYENNKSMSQAIRESITNTFGFEPICINSALVSAQNRQRLYWVGKRNEDGTYSKVNVQQPEDRGIILKDILERGDDLTSNDKAWTLTASYNGTVAWNTIERSQRNMAIEPVNITSDGKSHTIKAQYYRNGIANFITNGGFGATSVAEPVGTTKDEKSYCLTAGYANGSGEKIGNYAAHTLEKGCKSMVAEPVACRCRGRKDENGNGYAKYECREDNKANTLDTNSTNGAMVAEPVTETIRVGALPRPNGELSTSQAMRVYSVDGKSVNLVSGGGGMGGKTGLYAIPVEFNGDIPIKAQSLTDGKIYTVYEVKDGLITIKGKEYPIKLMDGYYIIRKLTVTECKRLQTVPEWYEFPVSDTQAYKMLGNGWTVDVIAHLIKEVLVK